MFFFIFFQIFDRIFCKHSVASDLGLHCPTKRMLVKYWVLNTREFHNFARLAEKQMTDK